MRWLCVCGAGGAGADGARVRWALDAGDGAARAAGGGRLPAAGRAAQPSAQGAGARALHQRAGARRGRHRPGRRLQRYHSLLTRYRINLTLAHTCTNTNTPATTYIQTCFSLNFFFFHDTS